MKTTNISLLHQSPDSLLTNVNVKLQLLHMVSLLIKETINALTLFYIKRDYQYFDPHVGETSCQIRAYMIYLMSIRSKSKLANLIEEIKQLKNYYQTALSQLADFSAKVSINNQQENKNIAKHQSLEEFLIERGLVFTISNEVKFLVQCYFLSRFKKTNIDDNTLLDHENISQEMNISRKLAKKIIHHFQTEIATYSVNFIERLLLDIPYYSDINLILNDLKQLDDDDRIVLPCYVNMKILLAHMHLNKCPLLLVINRQLYDGSNIDVVPILFMPYGSAKDLLFHRTIPNYYLKHPCVVIQGVVNYKDFASVEDQNAYIKRLSGYKISNIILSYMANHPQYSGMKLRYANQHLLSEIIQNRKKIISDQISFQSISGIDQEQLRKELNVIINLKIEQEKMEQMAKQIGCSETNKALFFIKHIFCDIVESYFRNENEHHSNDYLSTNKISIGPLLANKELRSYSNI